MFMFRSKRSNLIRRLWRVQRHGGAGQEQEGPDGALEGARAAAHQLLKRLKETQLALLVAAVESRGADLSACVLHERREALVLRRPPHVLCCQLWRWPDLQLEMELKRLSCCGSAQDPVYICCNPYHWSRLARPESPPPPYSRFSPEPKFRPEDYAPSQPVSQETEGTIPYDSVSGNIGEDGVHRRPWCKLAYWEHQQRVGELLQVLVATVHVFSDIHQVDGLCLNDLAARHPPNNDAVRRTREKIGLGLSLSQEEDGVWVYNRSDTPLFVNSPTLDPPNSRTLMVHKVMPGQSVKIFDYMKARYYQQIREACPSRDGPFDSNAVRISFAKGWGPKYSRQFITCCPCWLEILLDPGR